MPADWWRPINPGWWLLWALERAVARRPHATHRLTLDGVSIAGFVPSAPSGERVTLEADPERCATRYRRTE
jgi:hypothetical protein